MNIKSIIPKAIKGLAASAFLAGTILSTTGFAAPADVNNAATEAEITQALAREGGAVFPVGQPNTGYAKYFTGRSFLFPMQGEFVSVANVNL